MTVAVAYAGGESSKAALEVGVQEARRRRMTLVVINATLESHYESPRFTGPEQLQDLEERLRGSQVNFVIRQPVAADVADGVLTEVERVRAVLLVVGLRRRSVVGKVLLGSIAARIVLEARIPVLAVPPAMVEGH